NFHTICPIPAWRDHNRRLSGWMPLTESVGATLQHAGGGRMAFRTLAFSLLVVTTCSATAFAADLPIESRITAVTVHPQGAAIQREAGFSVPAGVSVLVVDDLPTDMAPD